MPSLADRPQSSAEADKLLQPMLYLGMIAAWRHRPQKSQNAEAEGGTKAAVQIWPAMDLPEAIAIKSPSTTIDSKPHHVSGRPHTWSFRVPGSHR